MIRAAHGWVEDQVWTASRVATLIGRCVSCAFAGLIGYCCG